MTSKERKKEKVVRKKSRNFEEKYFLHDFFNFVSFPLKTGTIYKKKEKVLLSFSFAVMQADPKVSWTWRPLHLAIVWSYNIVPM